MNFPKSLNVLPVKSNKKVSAKNNKTTIAPNFPIADSIIFEKKLPIIQGEPKKVISSNKRHLRISIVKINPTVIAG